MERRKAIYTVRTIGENYATGMFETREEAEKYFNLFIPGTHEIIEIHS